MAENTANHVTLAGLQKGLATLLTKIKDLLFDAAGTIKAALIPVGAGLKVVDGKVAFDAENVQIDASKVNIADASAEVKGLVKVGEGINVAEGVISVDLSPYAKTADLPDTDALKAETIAAIVDGAPEAYDTLKEVATYIEEHKSVETALNEAIGAKADKTALADYALKADLPAEVTDEQIVAAVDAAYAEVFGAAE